VISGDILSCYHDEEGVDPGIWYIEAKKADIPLHGMASDKKELSAQDVNSAKFESLPL
jgi:hypothetical protein